MDKSDPKALVPNDLSKFCLVGTGQHGNGSFPLGDKLTPHIWAISRPISFVAVPSVILLISCLLCVMICCLVVKSKSFMKAQGCAHMLYAILGLLFAILYILGNLLLTFRGAWTFAIGEDTNCGRHKSCFAVLSVLASIMVVQVILAMAQLEFSFTRFSHFHRRLHCVSVISFLSIYAAFTLTLFFMSLLIFPFIFPYFNPELGFCIWSLPQFIIFYVALFGAKLMLLLKQVCEPLLQRPEVFNSYSIRRLSKVMNTLSPRFHFQPLTMIELIRTLSVLFPFGIIPLAVAFNVTSEVHSVLIVFVLSGLFINNGISTPFIMIISTQEYKKIVKRYISLIRNHTRMRRGLATRNMHPLTDHNLTGRDFTNMLYLLKAGNLSVINSMKGKLMTQLLDNGIPKTPLIIASQNGQLKLVEALIEAGAVVDQVVEGDLTTALEYACFHGKDSVVEVLLKKSADANGRGPASNVTGIPLMEAARHGHANIVRMLILYGAEHNLVDFNFGRSALHWAVINENLETCHFLLKAGASLSLKDKSSQMPIDYATPKLRLSLQPNLNNTILQPSKPIVFLGDQGSGKSTLITSLKTRVDGILYVDSITVQLITVRMG